MLCDICGKKEATVHLTEIINEQMSKLHLCEECAKDKGAEMEEHFGLNDLLAGLAGLGASITSGPGVQSTKAVESIKCPGCSFTYQNFTKIGRFGCGECYDAFKKHIGPLLKRIHGSDKHLGKVPLTAGKTPKDTKNMQELRAKLDKAIQSEEFEEAARLRDKIKELDLKTGSDKGQK
jgi:protein arginine kinase activator